MLLEAPLEIGHRWGVVLILHNHRRFVFLMAKFICLPQTCKAWKYCFELNSQLTNAIVSDNVIFVNDVTIVLYMVMLAQSVPKIENMLTC